MLECADTILRRVAECTGVTNPTTIDALAAHLLPSRFVSAFTQGSDLDVAGAIGAMMCAVMPEDIADRVRDSIAASLKDHSLEAAADVAVWLVACWAANDPEGFAQLENEVWFEPLEAEMRALVGRWLRLPDTEKSVARRLSLAYSTSDDTRRKKQRANLQEENLAVWSQLNDLKRAHDELQRVRVEEVSLLEAQCASQEERLVTLTVHYNRQSNEEAEACRELRIATEKVTKLAGEANKARQDSKSLEEALLLVTGQTSRAAALEAAERQGVDREESRVKLAELEEEVDRLRHARSAKVALETELRHMSLRNASLTKELEVTTALAQQLQTAGHELKAAKMEIERLETHCFSLTTELASEREASASRLDTILGLKRSLTSLQVASTSPRKDVQVGNSMEMSMEVERLGTLVVQLQSTAAEKEAKLMELSLLVRVGEELASRSKLLEVSLQDAQAELRIRSEELACAKSTSSQIEEALARVTGADADKHTLLAKLTDRNAALCESLVQEKARYERCLAELEEVRSEAEGAAHVLETRVEELTSQVQDMEERRETERSLWAQQQADWTRQHTESTHVSDADVQRLRRACDDLRDRLADAEKRLADQSAEARRSSQMRILDLEGRLEASETYLAAARCELDKNAEQRRRLQAQLAHTEARRLALSGELANASAELRGLVDLAQAAAGHTANEEVVALRELCANLRECAESGGAAADNDLGVVRKQLLQKDWAFCEALSDKQRLLEELRELKASHAALKLKIWEAEKTEVLGSENVSKRADSASGTDSKVGSEPSDCDPVQSTPVVESSLAPCSPIQSTPVVESSSPSCAVTPVLLKENAPTTSKPPVKRRRGPRAADDADECKNQ